MVLINFKEKSIVTAPTLLRQVDGIGISELNGIIGFNRVPPDHNGAVGPDHVVSLLNHVMQIYDKNGNLQSTQQLETLFGAIGGNSTLPVDPNILYDEASGRFVFAAFEVLGGSSGPINPADDQVVLNVAVSRTSDPTDGWHVSTIDAKIPINGQNTWSDYPGIAVDKDAIYITANMFDFDAGPDGTREFEGNRLWIVEKGEGSGGLYDGGAINFSLHNPVASAVDLTGLGVSNATLMPVRYASHVSSETGVYLVATSGLSNGVNELVQIIHVTDPLGTPDFTAQTVSLGDISNENLSFLPQATQPGTSNTLASGDPRVNSGAAVWHEGSIYFTFSVSPKTGPNAGQTTTHWVELDATNPSALSLIQQGDIGGEDIATGAHTFHSSINVNKDGNILINFSSSGPTLFPGAYYALRGADDPLGQFGPAQTLSTGVDWYFRNRAGEGISAQTRNRWGDFSGVAVDPVDGTTFWFFNQFADFRGSPNAQGQDGQWRVTLGSARPTIQNFQFNQSSQNETFYGGRGDDGLQFNSEGASIVTVSPRSDGSIRGAFSSGAVAKAYFVEGIAFQGSAENDQFDLVGSYVGTDLSKNGVLAFGRDGNDILSAASVASFVGVTFNGGPGNDTLSGGKGGDSLIGGSGNDEINGNQGVDRIFGDGGADLLSGGRGADRLEGGSGDDTLLGGDGGDVLRGDAGNDSLLGEKGDDTVTGQEGDDVLLGGNGDDQIRAGDGADTAHGENGEDLVFGQGGNDTLFGGDGFDVVKGNGGDDSLFGEGDNDRLFGGDDNDFMSGGAGNDSMFGQKGFDTLSGSVGNDLLKGNGSADSLEGGEDNDTLFGGDGNDELFGGTGDDSLLGNLNNDTLMGEAGNDTLIGGSDNDTLIGGQDADTLSGRGGSDQFDFSPGDGNDVIDDFVAGVGTDDVISLIGFGTAFDDFSDVQSAVTQIGADVVLNLGSGDSITLLNVSIASLHDDDFLFS